jgi:putative acetyltransferase
MTGLSFSPILVRREIPEDIPAIHALNLSAFEGPGEASAVDLLRERCSTFVSIVAEMEGQVVGQVLFTPVTLLADDGRSLEGMGLAPLAVLPEFQQQGIGSILCRAGLEEIESGGAPFVVVLGHPGYYPRFGFDPAHQYGLRCAYDGVPPGAFMVKVFCPQQLQGFSGVVYYQPEFDQVT